MQEKAGVFQIFAGGWDTRLYSSLPVGVPPIGMLLQSENLGYTRKSSKKLNSNNEIWRLIKNAIQLLSYN